jgi:small subunit ribosomal protein S16
MAVSIKLLRIGKKGQPHYRFIVTDKRNTPRSNYIENIGIYNPFDEKNKLVIKDERLSYWLGKGAQISEGVRKLLKNRK